MEREKEVKPPFHTATLQPNFLRMRQIRMMVAMELPTRNMVEVRKIRAREAPPNSQDMNVPSTSSLSRGEKGEKKA